MANDFNIQIGVTPDGSDLQSKLNKIAKGLKDIDIKVDSSSVKDISVSYNEIAKTGKKIETINATIINQQGQLLTATIKYNAETDEIISSQTKLLQKAQTQTTELTKQANELKKQASLINQITRADTKLKLLDIDLGGIEQFGSRIKNLQSELSSVTNNKNLTEQQSQWAKINLEIQLLNKEVSKYKQNASLKDSANQHKILADRMDIVKTRADASSKSFNSYLQKLQPTALKKYSSAINDVSNAFEKAKQTGDKMDYSKASASLSQFKAQMKEAGLETSSLTQKIKENVGAFTNWYLIGGAVSSLVGNFKQSIVVLKEVDTFLTEISKTSDLNGDSLKRLGLSAYDSASKYGTTVQSYLSGYLEMSRGTDEETARRLSELSILAQSAGDMTAKLANDYIIATNAAYKYNNDVTKLNNVLDGQNQITNRNQVSMTELAEATKVAGSQAAQSGIEVDKMSAAVGTMIASTKQGGDVAGRAFKGILMNLQQVSGEIDGEIFNTDSFKKAEEALHNVGVATEEIVNGTARLRDPIQVLKELAQVYNSLPVDSVDKANVVTDLGGKHYGNQLAALLSNWQTYEKMLSDYQNASGSAAAEAQKTADSLEGRLNQLTNTWNRTVANIVDSDLLKFFVSTGEGAVDLVDKTNLLKQALIGLIALGGYKVLSRLVTSFKNVAIEATMFGNALNAVKSKDFIINTDSLSKALLGLNEKQMLSVLSTQSLQNSLKGLSREQLVVTLYNAGLSKSAAESTAATLTMSVAQKTATASTISLSGAFSSLGAIIATNPLGAIITALSVVVSVGSYALNSYKQKQEELIVTSKELTRQYKEEISLLHVQINSYKDLQEQIDSGNLSTSELTNVKSQLLDIQTNLVNTYGKEIDGIDLVNGKYSEQISLLSKLSKEKAQEFLAKNKNGYEADSKYLTETSSYKLTGFNGMQLSTELDEYLRKYSDLFVRTLGERSGETFMMGKTEIVLNKMSVEDAYSSLTKLYNDIDEKFGDGTDAEKLKISISNILNNGFDKDRIDSARKSVDNYLEAQVVANDTLRDLYSRSIDIVDNYKKALVTGEGVDEAKANIEGIKEEISSSTNLVSGSQVVFDNLFNVISTGADTAKNSLDNLNNDVAPSFDITKYSDNFKELTSHISTAESALNKLKEGKVSDSDVFQLMQDLPAIIPYIDMTTESFGDLEKGLKDIANLNYDNIIATLESAINTDSTKEYIRDINNAIDAVRAMKSEFNSTISVFKSLSDATNNAGDALSDLETITNAIIKTHKLTDAQVLALTERYSGLESSLIKTTDGWYLEESALNVVSGAASNLQTAYLDAQIAMNEMLQSGVKTRLSNLGIELDGIASVAEAYQKINSAMMSQESKGAVIKGGKVIGYWSGSEAENAYKEAIKYSDSIIALNKAKAKLETLQSGIGNSKSLIDKYTKKPTKTKETDPNKEAFEKSYEALKHKLSMEYITEKKYYDKLEVLYQKHFSDKKKYQSEYWQYEEEVYKGRDKLLDKSVNSINLAENSILNLQRDVDIAQNKLNNAKGYKKQIQAIEELTKAQEALRDGYQSVADMWEGKYKSLKGIKNYKTQIESGIVFKIEDFIGKEDLYKTVSQAQDFWRDWQGALSSIEGVTNNISSNYEKINSAVADASNALVDLQSEIVSALKSQYQELYDARVRYLKKETDDTIAMHNSTIKWLEKEIERIQGNTPQDKQKKLASLQGQYKDWLNDDSTLGKSKQKELLDQIEALNKEIKIDALQSQIEAEKDSIDNLREMLDEKLDKYSTKYDPILKNFDKSTSDLYAQANRLINLNKEQEIVNLLNNYGSDKYFNTIGNIMGKTAGELIASSVSTAISGLKLVVSQSGGSSGGSSATANLVDTRAISDILVGGNNGIDATGLSKLNQYAVSQGYDALTKKEMVDLAQKLGVTGITSTSDVGTDAKGKENKDKILEALKNSSFTDGGYVDAKSFNSLVKSTGEDGIALVKHGEPILTVEQGKQFKSLVENLKPLNSIVQLSKLNANNSSWIKNINASRSNEATFNRELVSVKIDKMINQTPFDIKNGEDNLNRMFTKSLQRSGVAIKR